jgi:hypothetical protein
VVEKPKVSIEERKKVVEDLRLKNQDYFKVLGENFYYKP